jgi:WD40 repeat protein
LKRFDESVPRQLGDILIRHGRSPVTDAKLCENLLKDYCPQHKEEIALLALAVKERIASDLLVSQDGLHRDLLRALLVKRLRKARSLNEGDARWAVESWTVAIRALARAESKEVSVDTDPAPIPGPNSLNPWSRVGVIAEVSKPVRCLAISRDTIVFGGDDGMIRLLRSHSITNLKDCEAPVSALAFSPNGVLIAFASGTMIEIIDLQSGETTLLGHIGKHPSLVFSPGGKSLAAASVDHPCEICVWNLQTGAMRVLRGAWKGPASISFSPDGSAIAAADSDLSNPSIRMWDVETGTARVLGRSTRQITAVAFLGDGKRIASGSWDETVRLWNSQTGESRTLGENCSCISHIAISTDGERLAASSLDGQIRVWDIQTGRSRTIGQCYGVNAMVFTSAVVTALVTALVTASEDGTVRLWNAHRF